MWRAPWIWLAPAALALLLLGGLFLWVSRPPAAPPEVVEEGPKGEEVGRMTPVTVAFKGQPDQARIQRALTLSPAVDGDIAWKTKEDGRVLVFQPRWPGYARGVTYSVGFAPEPAGLLEAIAFNFTTEGKLKVASAIPAPDSTEVGTDAHVVVEFNRPVAPLTLLQQPARGEVLRFDPPLAGEGKWLTSTSYVFRPADGLAPSTRYTVTVPRSLTDALGGSLEVDYSFSFSTVSPAISDRSPADASLFVDPGTQVKVVFNQPMDRASAEARFSLVGPDGAPVLGTFGWPDDRTQVFIPDRILSLSSKYEVRLAKGAAASGKPEAAIADDSRWSFTTVGLPGIEATNPRQGETAATQFGAEITFSNPMDTESVEKAISVSPKPDEGDLRFFWMSTVPRGPLDRTARIQPEDRRLRVNFPTKPSMGYTLSIGAGAGDRYGQPLPTFTLTYTTAPARPSLSIARSGSAGVFDASGDLKARISAINVSHIDFEILGLDLDTFMRIEARPDQAPAGLPPVRRWSVDISNPPLNEVAVQDVALVTGEGTPLGPGFYLLRTTSPEVSRPTPEQMPLVVTRTHLMLKRSDKEVLVWAVDMSSGQPLADLALTMYENDGSKRTSGRTDNDGVAVFDSERPPDGFSERLYVVAERPGDASIASNRWAQGFQPFNFQLPASFSRKVYSGYAYTDRPIYRPGQTVFYKAIVRSDNDARYALPPADVSFVIVITDARGRLVERRTVKPNDMGSLDGKLDLSPEAAIGFYNMQVWQADSAPEYGPDGRMRPAFPGRFVPPVTTASFQVAEYRKPEFEVTLASDQPEYVNGQAISAQLQARYFFGQPVANADVRWQVTSRPYFFSSTEAPYYSFNDLDQIYGQQRPPDFRVRRQQTGKTDAQGRMSFSMPADVGADVISQVFVIDATVTDANRQQVANSLEAIVHKGDFYIGMRPASYLVRAGEPAAVNLLTVDPKSKPVGDVAMSVSIYQRRWLSVRERQQDGSFLWRSVPQDTLQETVDLATGAEGKGSLTFTPAKGGTYRLVAEARDSAGNAIRSAAYLWVSSSEFIDWRVTNDNRIELRPDKDQYAPGDTARVLVTASFNDSLGLVTEERGTIASREVMSFPTNSTTIDVPITGDHIPNVYVSVALFKGATADNPVPSFRLGYAELKVVSDEKVINISIRPDKGKTEPRQKETYTIATSDAKGQPAPAELSLALVDKSVLTLAEDRAPKPLQAFWARRGLGVQTAAAYALLIDRLLQVTPVPPPGEGGKGGSGGGGLPGEDPRRLFPDTAYWNPTLRTDAQGRATVTVDLPDTLTTWRLTAKAVDRTTRVGEASNEIVTSKPLIVRPVTPRFFVVGDSVRLETAVHSFSDQAQQAQVTLKAQGLTLADPSPQVLSIPPGELRKAAWEVKVPVGDKAVVTFEARSESSSDAIELTLPVYSYSTPEVVATAGRVGEEPVTERVQVPGWAPKDRGELTLELSPSLAAAMNYSLRQVDEYPYEDTAITVSRLLPRIALLKAINQLGLPDTQGLKDKLPGLVTSSLQRLYNAQALDGGWSWTSSPVNLGFTRGLPGEVSSNPEITAYAVAGLAEAKRDGFPVDESVMRRGTDFLRSYLGLGRDVARPLDPNTRAFVLYALAAAGQGDLGLTNALAQERAKLGNDGKGLLALAILALTSNKDDVHLKALMSDLTTSAVTSSTGTHWEDPPGDRRTMNSSTRSTAIVLLALSRVSPTNPLVESTVRWLMVARREGHWATTQETAWSLLALADYLGVSGELKAEYSYQVRVNDQVRLEKKVDASVLTQSERLALEIKDFDEDNRIGMARSPADAPGRLYYTETLRYFPPGDNVEAINRGIGVGREYLPAAGGNAITSATAGDLVQVRLTVVAPTDLNYVVVEDYLPAGFEPIDTTLKTTSQADRQLLAQLRQALQPRQTRRWFYVNPFERAEMRDNRVALFATFLPKGVHQYVYLARATTAGEFRVMPARAYETFFPEVWGRNDGVVFTVRP